MRLDLEEEGDPDPDGEGLLDYTPGFALRDYQLKCLEDIEAGWKECSRQLVDMPTGSGKSTVFAALAKQNHKRGGKTLILAHRDKLVRQAAGRIEKETGISVDIEMADEYASTEAPIVVGSIQTLCSETRLLGFNPSHFSLVVADECHHSISPSWTRVLSYFHFGDRSLDDGWVAPAPGDPYKPLARILGVTATPTLAGRRQLGEFYQRVAFSYSITEAVRDGWLVPLVMKSMPLEIDLRGLRPSRTPNGSDFTDGQLSQRLVPVIEALAKQICLMAPDRKTIAFVPSIECAELLADAVNRNGLKGIFVSGQTEHGDDTRTRDFIASGPGTVLANCALYTEGADFPDVNCIVFGRCTKSEAFYRQMGGRGTRVLPGIVDGVATPEERRALIALSAKKDLLLLDPLWLHDRMEIMSPYNLVTSRPEVAKRMAEIGGQDLMALEAQATRDFISALTREAKRQKNKAAAVLNPLEWAVDLGDEKLAVYEPQTAFDARAPTAGQLDFLRRQKFDVDKITSFGMASALIGRIMGRYRHHLCTPKQLHFLAQLGFKPEETTNMTEVQASAAIDARLKDKKAREAARRGG